MLVIVLAIAVMLPGLVGWGMAFATLLAGRPVCANIGELGLHGLFAVSLLGLVLHFIMPLSTVIVVSALLAGYYLLWRHRADIAATITLLPRWRWAVPVLLICLFAFLAYIREVHADTELYHLPAIVWVHQSRLPVGIAALVDQMGFNTIWFVTAALLWIPGFGLTSVFAVNAAIMVLFFLALGQHGYGILRTERATASGVFAFLVVVFLFTEGASFLRIIGSPNTDIPAALIAIYCFFLAIRALEARGSPPAFVQYWMLLAAMSVFAAMIKLSQAPLLLLPLLLGAIGPVIQGGGRERKTLVVGTAVLSAGAVLWLVRGLLTSGCLAYPVVQSCLESIPWVVARDVTVVQHDSIRAFGLYGELGKNTGLSDWSWLPAWWLRFKAHHFARGMVYMVLIVMTLAVIARTLSWRASRACVLPATSTTAGWSPWFVVPPGVWWLPLMVLVFTGYWFLAAPDIRFGYGYLTVLTVFAGMWLMAQVGQRHRKVMTYPLAGLFVLSLVLHFGKLGLRIDRADWFGRWPAIEARPLPRPPCPDLLGIWPLFKCPA